MNEGDFSEIVRRTKKTVLSAIAKNLSADYCYAIDDVAQEVYIRAYRSLLQNAFRGDSSIETWLFRIAVNESLRMNGRCRREEEKAKKIAERVPVVEQAENTDRASLAEHISRLPEKYRSVLSLISEGYSIQEIAGKLGISPGTVKSRTSRGKKIIHENLRSEEYEG